MLKLTRKSSETRIFRSRHTSSVKKFKTGLQKKLYSKTTKLTWAK